MTIKWDQQLRFKLIEVVALWEGRVTTNHLCNSFNIKRQQASRDIKAFQAQFDTPPLIHDRSIKGYRPTEDFTPRFTKGSPNEYLSLLHKYSDEHVDGFDIQNLGHADSIVLSVPDRHVAPIIVRRLLQAAREKRRVDIEYVSLSTPEIRGRIIAPHSLVYDGIRWHVRAYCEEKKTFRDFVLSRFRNEPDLMDHSPQTRENDDDWNQQIPVTILPNPYLSKEQQYVVAADYAMKDQQLTIVTRKALMHYYLRRIGVTLDKKLLSEQPELHQLTAYFTP